MGLKITKGSPTSHFAEVVELAVWKDGLYLKGQLYGGTIHSVKVKADNPENWVAANQYINAIPEIKQYLDELKRRPY